MKPPHALYRLFDETGQLLYVGISADPGKRMLQHRSDKVWWEQSATIHVQPMPDRQTALAAEKEAIKNERPLYNKIHSDLDPTTSAGIMDVLVKFGMRELHVARDEGEQGISYLADHAQYLHGLSAEAAKLAGAVEWTSLFLDEALGALGSLLNYLPQGEVRAAKNSVPSTRLGAGEAGVNVAAAQVLADRYARQYVASLPDRLADLVVERNTDDGETQWVNAADEARMMIDGIVGETWGTDGA